MLLKLISLRSFILLLILWGTNLTPVEARNDTDADLVKTSLLFQCTNGLQIGINNIVRKGPWVFEFTGPPAHAKIIDSYQAKFENRTQKLTWLDKEKQNEIILKKDNDQEVDFNTKFFDKKTQTTTLCKLIK